MSKNKSQEIAKNLQRQYPDWTVVSGSEYMLSLQRGDLMIWLDQNVPAISYTGRIPDGYRPDYPNDGPTCWRILVSPNGELAASIYGLLYAPESLPDLVRAAHSSGAIEVARSLYCIPTPDPGIKWFDGDVHWRHPLHLATPDGVRGLHKQILALRRSIR